MANGNETPREGQITASHETIEQWADEEDAIPARRGGHEPANLTLVRESELSDAHDQLTWEEFFDTFEDADMVAVYHETGDIEVLERDEATRRVSVETDELEEALLAGETVTSTITETAVVERTVVEEMSLESQVVDREVIDETYVDAERVARDVTGCEVTDSGGARHDPVDFEQFNPGAAVSDEFDVEVTVEEDWSLTTELLDRLTIESRIADTDVEAVGEDDIRSTIDAKGLQRTLLQSDLFEAEVDVDAVVDTDAVYTEFREGDVIETQLLERQTMDEEVAVTKRFTGTITEGETIMADTVTRETVDRAMVEDQGVHDVSPIETTEPGEVTPTEAEAEATMTAEGETLRTQPSDDDEGKQVVDANDDEVGMVVEVESDTVYVEPNPSLADRIKTALDWGEGHEDAYPIDASQISRITDDNVHLAAQEEL